MTEGGDNMNASVDKVTTDHNEADRLTRCLSMIAHHEEVQVMLAVIEELLEEQEQDT